MSSWHSALFLGVWAAFTACGSDVSDVIVLVNDIDQVRTEEPVVITRTDLEARIGAVASGLLPLAVADDGAAVPGQVDDVDGDGRWDDWALLISVGAKDEAHLRVSLIDSTEMPRFKVRTNVRVEGARSRTPEAVAWENDVVGFRMTLRRAAGKQVLGKITMEMVLDSVEGAGTPDEMSLWGMEIVNGRSSLGGGSLAIWKDGRLQRPQPETGTLLTIVSEGPARSVFNVRYSGWMVDETACDLTERITIWAGRPGYESTVTLHGIERDLVAGIARPRNDTMYQWEWESPFQAIAAHGRFGASNDVAGLAVLYRSDQDHGVGGAEVSPGADVSQSYYVRLRVSDGAPSTHYLYAVWDQQDYRWADQASFEGYLRDEALRLASPIRLR